MTSFPFTFTTSQPGITSRHCFSAGPHYDPSLLSFGPVIGCDEHVLAPGAGFAWHAHAGVVIVSLVLSGRLRHEDGDGTVLLLDPGPVLVQSTGDGIRHTESNALPSAPLRFVQTTLLLDAPRHVAVVPAPVQLAPGVVFGAARPGATFSCGPVIISLP